MAPQKSTQTWLANISVRARLLVICLCVGVSFASLAMSWSHETQRQLDQLNARAKETKKELITHIIQLKSGQLLNLLYDYSYWDDLKRSIIKKDTKWIGSNVLSVVEGQRLDGLWIFNRNGDLLVRKFRNPSINTNIAIDSIFTVSPNEMTTRWYQKEGSDVWEVYGTTIHNGNDAAHKGEYYGYMFIARRIGADYMINLKRLAQCDLTLVSPQHGGHAMPHAFDTPLKDAHGRKVAALHAEMVDPHESLLLSSTKRVETSLIGLALVVLFTLGIALLHWIGTPIRHLAMALERKNPEALTPLLSQKTEFGALARLVHAFFLQEMVLIEARDRLEQRVLERTEALEHQAYHDSLTGLPNRLLFRKQLDTAVEHASLGAMGLAVVFIDIDNFKVINDSLGHEAGDQVLCMVAERIVKALRPTDMLARISGDEFAILLPGMELHENALKIAERIQQAFQVPLQLQGSAHYVTLSSGVALFTGEESAPDLLRNADTAMYMTKAQGKAGVCVFDSQMKQQADLRLELELELRRALSEEGQELSVAYQPLFVLETGEIWGVEALVRWNHATLGAIAPAQFIPVAEEAGLIDLLGQRVLREAASCVAAWSRQYRQALCLNVNLSVHQLQEGRVVEEILTTLHQSGLSPCQLTLELTESVMMRHPALVGEQLTRLRAQGVRIAVDDFGTGYSSMAVLAQLPLDLIKIDRSFVVQLEQNPEASAIIKAIIELAHALNLQTVAEGIETRPQWELLQRLGAELGQGYYFSRPLTTNAMEQLLAEQQMPIRQAA